MGNCVSKLYKIDEIFYSIQGEGYWTGTPMIFVRFYGCNLNCEWCDTPQDKYIKMSSEDTLNTIDNLAWISEETRINRVCFTGGEPLLQFDSYLFEKLFSYGYKIHIETNGTIIPDDKIMVKFFLKECWVTVSPKSSDESWKLRRGSELKIVYTGQFLDPYFDFVHKFKQKFIYLQPCSKMNNTEEVISLVKLHPDKLRLSVQTHKLLGIK